MAQILRAGRIRRALGRVLRQWAAWMAPDEETPREFDLERDQISAGESQPPSKVATARLAESLSPLPGEPPPHWLELVRRRAPDLLRPRRLRPIRERRTSAPSRPPLAIEDTGSPAIPPAAAPASEPPEARGRGADSESRASMPEGVNASNEQVTSSSSASLRHKSADRGHSGERPALSLPKGGNPAVWPLKESKTTAARGPAKAEVQVHPEEWIPASTFARRTSFAGMTPSDDFPQNETKDPSWGYGALPPEEGARPVSQSAPSLKLWSVGDLGAARRGTRAGEGSFSCCADPWAELPDGPTTRVAGKISQAGALAIDAGESRLQAGHIRPDEVRWPALLDEPPPNDEAWAEAIRTRDRIARLEEEQRGGPGWSV